MKDNIQVSFGINGMQKNNFNDLLDEKTYIHARNANLETDTESIGLTNEHSNLLCSKFKPDYIVIGTKYDSLNARVWFLITEKYADENGKRKSEIGYISHNTNISDVEDMTTDCGCDIVSILNEPLENTLQTEYCTYTTLLEDSCNNCLNFDPNYPAHTIVLKQEACGFTMTFATKNNPPRYIILDQTEQYRYTGSVNCGIDNTEPTCLDCEKLRVFPLYQKPHIQASTINYGGNLRRGAYEFFIAYCDKLGNEISPYIASTNQIDLFDPDSIQLEQANEFSPTKSAIRLTVDNLDQKFNFYKVAVVEKTETGEIITVFEEGIHLITDKNIIYTSNGNIRGSKRMSLNKLFLDKPVYKNWGGIIETNGYLMAYDYEVEKEWNLQPVVNLMGTFLKWQSVEGSENLYKDGVNISKYKSYMRDEVYPIGIRFISNTGYKTSLFPFIGRPAMDSDLIELDPNTNQDVKSIRENSPNCSTEERKYQWQFYNTAKILGDSVNSEPVGVNTKIVIKEITEECIQQDVKTLQNGEINIPTSEPYYGLYDYVENHYNDICNPSSIYYNADLCQLLTDDVTQSCNPQNSFPFPICYANCEGGTCDPPVQVSTPILYLSSVINETNEGVPKDITDYEHQTSTANCLQFMQGNIQEVKYNLEVGLGVYGDVSLKNYKDRLDAAMNNHTCATANLITSNSQFFTANHSGLITISNTNPWTKTYYVKDKDTTPTVTLSTTFNSVVHTNHLLTNIDSVVYPGFNQKIHKEALWYQLDFTNTDEIILEISPVTGGIIDATTLTDDDVRFTIFNDCTSNTVLSSGTYKSHLGMFKVIKKADVGNLNKVFLCLDTKIIRIANTYETSATNSGGDSTKVNVDYIFMVTSTLPNCFDVRVRVKEYESILVKFDVATVSRKTLFKANCRYVVNASDDCGVIPHKYGYFAYWESTEKYPDNPDLYNSEDIKLDLRALSHEDTELMDIFRDGYVQTQNTDGIAIWKTTLGKSNVNFTCEPIKHPKMPDNVVLPFMSTDSLTEFSDSRIFPIGLTIDEKTINVFLDSAVESGLITQEQRDSIIGYELYRGDRTVNKSIIYKGILNDMYQDPYNSGNNQKAFFRNFPYNTLGKNVFITDSESRQNLISHPHNSTKNDRFSLIAPEVYYGRPNVPAEFSIDGYVYGNALTGFADVKDHSEWVLLGSKAFERAKKLANAEITLEIALNLANMISNTAGTAWFMVGLAGGTNAVGVAIGAAAIATYAIVEAANINTFKRPKLMSQWMDIFEQRGSVNNFASMAVSPKGFYNSFKPNTTIGNFLRGVDTGKYLGNGLEAITEVEGNTSKITLINNKDRENSVYLFTGSEYPVEYPQQYITYDNYDSSPSNASRYNGCENSVNTVRRIASPYVTMKNYVPDQYGGIDEIKWLSTNHNSKFNNESKNIFGGDSFISRVDLKNKFPFFRKNAVTLANRTPFRYSNASNVGYTRFYVDHKSADEETGSVEEMPFLLSSYNMDCHVEGKRFYEVPPSKFYLFSYGVPYFLVESEINCNFRYAGKELHEQFASSGLNVEDWVQEVNTSIAYNNIFYYNSVYSRNQTGLPYRTLPAYYDREKWDCLAEAENGVAWSQQDNSEVSLADPWLVFKPFDIYRFKFSYGKLISLNSIESTQVVGRFSDNMAVFNAVDVLRDRINSDNETLGTGGIFATRPVQYSYTELGETGTQHRAFVSCEFGHFWVDAKRGKVFQLKPNASGLDVISDFKAKGDESGLRKWFKRNLPFKILNQGILNLRDIDLDNTYKGLGILMWWDSRFKRVFITKRDYVLKPEYKGSIQYSGGNFYLEGNPTPIELTNTRYFKDISWTLAYSPIYGSWVSFYDFKPDYAVSYNNYFQTGLNYSSDSSEQGIWSHLLSNKSYQVYYGNKYPFEIELPIKNTYTNNTLTDLKIWTSTKRYHNESDFAVWKNKSFNKLNIYNDTDNSGLLSLYYDTSYRKSKYPIAISPTRQGIQATHFENKLQVNYIYNRVKNQENHMPIWNWDENEINKELNSNAVSFNSKKILERLRGSYFIVRLIQDEETRFKQIFKWMTSEEKSY